MAYETILVGSGRLYRAPVGTAMPDVDEAPGGSWTDLGMIDGGVTMAHDQTIDEHMVDNETGAVKATRSAETCTVTANLAESTLENLAAVLNGQTVSTDTDPAIKYMGIYQGLSVQEYAFLFRANSPYGAFPSQYECPRGYFSGNVSRSFVKDGKTLIPAEFKPLVDPNAVSAAFKFGRVVAQTGA